MTFLKPIRTSTLFIRLRSWEYWPFGIIQFPIFFYWLWLSLKARSLVFFSTSNPRIILGGMFGESKFDVLKSVPSHLKPKTILITLPTTMEEVLTKMEEHHLRFPVFFKPDLGERGFMVQRISTAAEANQYIQQINSNFLIQELVDLPVECGVFYVRYPNEENGRVTSLVLKEMLSVTGDGVSTVEQLILNENRARLQFKRLQQQHTGIMKKVLPAGERLELVSIGNHCLGTKFIDGSEHLSDELSDSFDRICKHMDEFYFGRIDLRCASLEHLKRGDVQILEVNGCGAEPGHIYHPGFPLSEAIGVLFAHWRTIFDISMQNRRRGRSFTSLSDGIRIYKHFRLAMRPPESGNEKPRPLVARAGKYVLIER